MLHIPISGDDAYDCLDAIVVAVANWYGCDYQLMFSNSWEFEYSKCSSPESTIGQNIIPVEKNDRFSLLGKYHGLYLDFFFETTTEQTVKAIMEELALGKPISLFMDTFWCPWYKGGYQEFHAGHTCLVVGSDESKEVFYCIDGQMTIDPVELPIEMLRKGCNGYLKFTFIKDHVYKVNWKDLIDDSIKNTGFETNKDNFFDEMVYLAQQLKENFDITKEIKGFEKRPFQALIFKKLLQVGRGRKQYAQFLKYIGEINSINELITISYDLDKVGKIWSAIFGMIVKGVYIGNPSYIIDRVSAKVINAANIEKSIARNLRKIISAKSDFHDISSQKMDIMGASFSKFYYICLDEYFNNQGFSEIMTLDCKAEFSNVGRYFLNKNLPIENEWSVDNMKFRFPEVSEAKFDNISCSGDSITIETEDFYSAIMFLGSAEFGNHSEEILLEYNDGTSEEVTIEFTSWLGSKPTFGECVAWSGKAAVRGDTGVVVYPFPVHIYANAYIINNRKLIRKLILPQCPNIHVFSITLAC